MGEGAFGGAVALGCGFPSDDFPAPFSPFFCGDPFCCCPALGGGTDWDLKFPLPLGFWTLSGVLIAFVLDGGDLSGNFNCFRVSIEWISSSVCWKYFKTSSSEIFCVPKRGPEYLNPGFLLYTTQFRPGVLLAQFNPGVPGGGGGGGRALRARPPPPPPPSPALPFPPKP